MPEEQLKTDEDVEAILRLAVQQPSIDSADLRSRLTHSAAELGISEEQLRLAEAQYFEEKEAELIRAEKEAAMKAEIAQERKRTLRRFAMFGLGACALWAFILVTTTSGFSGGSVMIVFLSLLSFKGLRGDRWRSGRNIDN